MSSVVALLVAGLVGVGCDSAQLVSTDGKGGSGGNILTGMGGDLVIAGNGGFGGAGAAGAGGSSGGRPSCMPDYPRAVLACGLYGAPSLALAPGGKAFVSFQDDTGHIEVSSWDNISGAWTSLTNGGPPRISAQAPVLRVDSQGAPVIAYVDHDATNTTTLLLARWNGTIWVDLAGGSFSGGSYGLGGFDLEVDALNRPVLLLNTPSPPWGNELSVWRLASGTWTAPVTRINSMSAASGGARLALDSADGITPGVAYRPESAKQDAIIALRFENGTSWRELPALTRALNADFDFAVAGGQPFLAYLDGTTLESTRVYVSQGNAGGWSTGVLLNGDSDRPAVAARILATGPSPDDLIVAYEENDTTFAMHQVSVKQAPGWTRVPGDMPPVAGADMEGFTIAVDPSRIGIVWMNREPSPLLAYHEFPR